jgi:hypothetical protein
MNTARRSGDPRGASSDVSHQMLPLATYERRRLCACAPPGPAKTAAHIYPPKGDHLEESLINVKRRTEQMRHADSLLGRITVSLSFSLCIFGDDCCLSWLRRRSRLSGRTERWARSKLMEGNLS